MTDFRALCAELVEKLDELNCNFNVPNQSALIERSCTALAQPEPQEPTNEELLKLIADKLGYELTLKVGFQEVYGSTEEMVSLLRTVLARWGRPAQPEPQGPKLIYRYNPTTIAECGGPCEQGPQYCDCGQIKGEPKPQEVTDEELLGIEDLEAAWNAQADAFNSWDELGLDEIVCWAQQQALARWGRPAVEPMPVSERLPGPKDCDAEGRCWIYDQGDTFTAPAWNLENKADLQDLKQMQNEGKLIGLCERWRLAWLPHWALPVPKSEAHNG